MVQIVQQEEKVPVFTFKLKFIYFVILLTAMVVIYMLTFGEGSSGYQDELIYTDNSANFNSMGQKVEESFKMNDETQKPSDSGNNGLFNSVPSSTTTTPSSNSPAVLISTNQQNVIVERPATQPPQQSLVQQPQQGLAQPPVIQQQQSFVQQPQQNLIQQPQQNVAQPQIQAQQNEFVQPVIQQTQQGLEQQPQQSFEQQPAIQQPQQSFVQQPAIQQPAQPQLQQQPLGPCPTLDTSSIHERITKVCKVERFKNNWNELVAMYDIPPQHLLYDVDRNYVWVTVPKVASSNIKRVIIKEKLGYEEDSEEMKQAMLTPHITLANCCLLTAEVAREYYSLQRAFTFTFIRNPWTRLYSAFKDKIATFKGYEDYYYIRKILFTVRDWTWEEVKNDTAVKEAAGTITFTEFLTMLAKTDAENYNDHWKPWFLLTQPCMIKYDYIGYLEDIGAAYKVVQEKAFSDLDIELGGRYQGSSGSASIIEAYKAIPQNLLDVIMSKFEDDFNIGGYSKDINCIDQPLG